MESSTKYEFADTSRGKNQASRAGEPLMAGYPVLRQEPTPDYTIMINDCANSAIALAVGKLLFTGPGVPNARFEIPFKRIEDAWVGCAAAAQAQILKLTGDSESCCQDTFRKSVAIEYFDGVQYQTQYFEKIFSCDCEGELTEAQRVQALVDVINGDAAAVVTAARATNDITFTSKVAGRPIKVSSFQGFINLTTVQVNIMPFGKGQQLLEAGFDVSLLDLTADYSVINIDFEEKVDLANGPFGGSRSDTRPYVWAKRNVWVAFGADCGTLKTTLMGILNGTATAALYTDRITSDNCNNPTPTPTPSPSASPSPTPSASA